MNHYYDDMKILPHELNSNINDIILDKLKNKIGNKCNKYGYIKKDSIEIISKTIGKIISGHFDGSVYYKIEFNADIVNPNEEDIIDCKILKKNKHGILANYDWIHSYDPLKSKCIPSRFIECNHFNILDHI